MSYHERNLPHWYPPEATLFVTWRLFGSLSHSRGERDGPNPQRSARVFVQTDRILDTATDGPLWLKDERIAELVAKALEQGDKEYRLYELLAWVIMRWIKGSTARSANLIPRRTGKPFWQYESYDHCVRNADELARVIRYIERNPVFAGLAAASEDWRWSSSRRRPTPQ
jgi:hypothetical protein